MMDVLKDKNLFLKSVHIFVIPVDKIKNYIYTPNLEEIWTSANYVMNFLFILF